MTGFLAFTDLEYDFEDLLAFGERGLFIDDDEVWWLAYEVVFPLGDLDQIRGSSDLLPTVTLAA